MSYLAAVGESTISGPGTSKTAKSSIKVTKMIKGPAIKAKRTPSNFLFEMKQSTEEKLANTLEMYPPKIVELLDIGTSSHQKDVSLDVDQALFQPYPSEVFFQQFEPRKTYVFPLQLRNLDKVARHIKVTYDESPYFTVTCQKLAGSKVAPGMEITYQITFTPDENKDYIQELVFVTEREKFIVPVQAIGARALLDFPDDVTFSAAPVKYASTNTVLVRNVGNREAKFNLETELPFSVTPTTSTLAVGACMQVSVEFTPKKLGDHNKELIIHYNTGEVVCTQLYGSAVDVNVRLDRSSLTLGNTYLGLSSERSVVLHNRSNVVVHYQWKAFASELEENVKRLDKARQLAEEEALSKETFFDRCMHDPFIRDRLPILTRNLDIKKKYLDEEKFLYSDEAITLDPIEGDIWPNSQAEVSVMFQPEEATSYSRVLYCDITGRESRLPLKIRGEGVGPRCVFSFDTLDIQNVFVNSAHAYEAVIENKGDIEAVFSLVPSESLFGPKFTFAPSNGVLSPGKLQAVQISFSSSELGGFNEEFQWSIEGSPQPLRLKIQGEVIGPTFQFDTSQINFGTVPYGFQTTKEVVLTNTSEIPMTFTLHVPGSGDPSDPVEFEILPESGTLPPNFHQVIQLHFTPSSVKAYSAMLVVDIQESGRNVFSLPINAKATVPPIQLLTPLLNYGRCFLKHSYSHDIELLNDSEFPVKYSMCPQVDKSSLIYSSAQSNGVIAPHTTHSIELLIETQAQGEILTTALIDILGGNDPQLELAISCIGEGPVINVKPDYLAWGVCPVLSHITKTILLSNESIIPAEFECTLAREKTIFSVEPISAVIPPDKSLELSVTALVDDSLKFSDKLTIVVSDGVSFTVSLSAEGQGTTIVSHPPLLPGVDLGHYFSNGPCQNKFTLTNRGRRVQALSWTTEGFSAAKLRKAELEKRGRDKKDMVVKHSFNKFVEVKKPLFEMIPNKWILEPYQSLVVTLNGHSDIPQVVNERLICHAIIGKNPLKERIMTVDVRATFVAPLLKFSSQELLFKLHQPPGSKLVHHSQELGVCNISPLPVTSLLLCEYPFSIIRDGLPRAQVELVLMPQQDSTITVLYDSTYCADKHSRQEDTYLAVAYKEHSQKDRITLKAEVHFPNLSFEFMELDFGCILNDTESIQHITMTNNSPLEVAYSWSFLKRPPAQHVDPSQLDEGVDMQSECETDSLDERSDQEDDTSLDATSVTTGQDNDNSPSIHSSTVSPSLRSCNSHKRSQQGSPGSKTDGDTTSHSVEGLSTIKDDVHCSPEPNELQKKSAVSSAHSREISPTLVVDTADEAELDSGSKSAISEIKPQPWELLADPFTPIRIEQIFDILPLHGMLAPGTSQQVQFSFYGHSGVATEVTAACRVEGGPTYQLRLGGEASEVQYRFSKKWIDLGKAMYDQVHTSQILLYNSGKVDLDYSALGANDSILHAPTPGSLSVHPPMGHIPALGEQIITITFLPGVPSVFEKNLYIQVAHFEPEVITVTGEAVFPRIGFDIQRDLSQVAEAVLEEAKTNLSISIESESGVRELEAEVERLLVCGYAQAQTTNAQKKSFRGLPRFHLDFGYVVYGMVASRTFHLTNVGHIPVSFTTPHKLLRGSGFSVDLGEKVKALPPDETLDFTVTFDPAAIKCSNGKRLIEVFFNLVGGPSYSLVFTAQVTRPCMQFSESYVDFGTVVCGQCRLITIRLTNPVTVSCKWTAVTAKPPKKIPRHVPLHLRKKMREKPPPNFFEVNPSSGVLLPGKTADIKIIFMPSEEIHYVDSIPFSVHQNPDSDLCLHVEGGGSEPQLVFSPSLVKYEPVLPFSPGSETEITVSNPMPYPVEFYSLEFDKQYLEEEEILRDIKEYDSQQRLMLPPPTLGESLPNEIIKAYKYQKSDPQQTDTETNLPNDANLESTISVQGQSQTTLKIHDLLDDPKSVQPSTDALVSTMDLPVIESLSALTQLTAVTATSLPEMLSPVKQAIAQYLGIDLSPEAAEAEKRKGVAIIVHGPPSSGRTTQVKRIAKAYGATVLVMDQVIIEAISSARTESGRKARKHLIDCAMKEDVNDAPSGLSVVSKKQFNAKEKDKEPIVEAPPLPVPPSHFNVDVLQNSDFAVPEGRLMPTALPENLAYEILAERLQQSDCYRGVVFDGIESHFAASIQLSTCIILRAFSNRTHIYFVNLEMDFVDIQKRLDNIEEIKRLQEETLQKELLQKEQIENERIEKLLALDEDEYEAKSLEEQRDIDTIRFRIKKEQREKRKREKEEQKRREVEVREEEIRRLEEEKMKKKGRKDPNNKQHRASNTAKPPAVTVLLLQTGTSPGQSRPGSSQLPTHGQLNLGGTGTCMAASGVSVQSEHESPGEGTPKRKVPKKGGPRSMLEDDQPKEFESLLQKQYNHYTILIDSIKSVLEDWDRQKGILRPKKPLEIEEPTTKNTPSRKGKGGKLKEENIEICPEIPEPEESREGLGVSLLAVQANQDMEAIIRRLFNVGLPSTESILDGLGLSTDRVPIPGPVDFQVYPFPLKRRNIDHVPQERFCFIASSSDDLNAPKEEAPKPPPEPVEEPPSEQSERSERDHSSRVSKRTASVRSTDTNDSAGHKKSPQKISRKKSSMKITSPSPSQFVSTKEETSPVTKAETKLTEGPVKLVRFRWVVPPDGETKLKLLFQSQEDVGQFDQTLNFEITGTRRRTQLFCRGHCEVPTICQEPRSVFPSRKKTKDREEIVHKKFVLSENTYYFGPLHCGKTRDRYKDCRYPENMEVLQIKNISLSTIDVEFCFQKDQNANTFLLDPPNMTLMSGESETLRIWAYPKSADEIKDALVCCIKHNPNPVVFKLVCNGVEPDLKIDRKLIEFKKVLLHRKQTNVIYLHNHTMLPVAWKLSGLESLGEEFSFSQVEGVVQPRSDFPLSVNFRAAKQINHVKKAFKIEISDVQKIMGLMHVENVQVVAEAYDVALDISFPKGTDGGLDFQCIRACDEQKLMIYLKNKGKYDIAYNFLFDVSDTGVDYNKIFSFSPTHNTLYPGEKAQPVSVVFKSNKEFTIVNAPILKCQVIDAHVGEQGEVIANIPIRISAKAVFAQPLISPVSDINFGPMIINARKSASFTLENKGDFEFKYAITKKMSSEEQKIRAISMAAVAAKNRTKSRDGRESSTARMSFSKPNITKHKSEGPLRTEVIGGSQRLILGIFTINSAMGSILAGQSQIITVDCIADDRSGPREEILSIEVSDRQVDSPPLNYKICGEVLQPEINTVDVASIFEEHRVCRRLGVLGQHQFHGGCIGVYGEEERRFVFKSVIVGQLAKARFKISNNNKISCDVLVSVKSPTVKQKGSNDPVFEVQPSSKIAIPSHSHIYAIVNFKPAAMQCYNATFEVTPESATKSNCLIFELQGDGNLPQVAITRPTLLNAKGGPILLFKRLLLSQSQTLTATLKNIGTIPANVLLENTGDKAFTVTSMEDEIANFEDSKDSQDKKSIPPCCVSLDVNESKDCLVVFNPRFVNKYHGEVCLCIQDNQFEKPGIQLVGEGYEDDVCLENVRGEAASWGVEDVAEDTNASVESHLHFGSIAVSESRQMVFTLSNRSKSNTVKFQWPTSLPCLTFAPSLGHIKPGSSKDITVTFKAQANPESISAQIIAGKIWKISFSQPLSKVADWDDRMKSVRWVNIVPPQPLSVDSSGTSSVLKQSISGRVPTPAKRKVIETDPEPAHSVVDESHRNLEVLISAVADFAKFMCPVKEIRFKDTLMYQSKVFSFSVTNNGVIPVTYEWVMIDGDLKWEMIQDEGMPFSIEPSTGIIQPDTETTFTVKFAPLDVFNMQSIFRCNMPNLDGSLEPLTISVYGRSLMPYCHFELEHTTDYFSRRSSDGRRSFESSETVDPASTRVIEFTSCGVGVRNTKRFEIINPTSSGYEFQWTAGSSLQFDNNFKCLTPKGYVESGKKFEIAFEYTPSSLESVESVWVFSIPSICLSHSFLLAGHTDEPSVNLDRAYLTFKAMLIGSKMKDTVYLVSNEPTPYKFSFDEKSCHCDGHSGQLVVEPMTGTIQPNTKIPVTISFTARHEQDYNFNLNCKIKHKPDPLVLNVKATGYAINTALSYTSPGGTEISLPVGKSETRVINFGSIPVNERALGQISVFNNGEYNMEYKWILSSKCKTKAGYDLVCLSPMEGTVVPQDKAKFEVTFSPPLKMVLKGCEIQLQIVNGPTFPISLRGMGVEPQVEFSFEEYDFGPHFLHRSDMPATRKTLNIINNDKKDISVHCLYKDQPHLSVQFMSCILAPKEEAQAVFEFRPRDTISYSESVVFEINGLSRKSVSIRGDGAQMKIELADPAHKEIKFGALRIGEKVKKELKLANHSPIPLSFRLSLLLSSSTPALFKDGVLCVSPTEEISVQGNGGQSTVSIAFNPTTRVPQFSEEVTLECLGISQPLFVVSGSCIGLEIALDTDYIPFGPVIQDSQSSRRILMINSGDIGARFSWDNRFGPDFELAPLDGYISPGMQITFDLTFRPSKLSHDIRYDKIPCHIEGRAKPLHLTLTGVCIEKVPIKEVLPFTTCVRSKETRNLTISNKTNSHWLLRPLIEGEQWSGPETLSIGSNQSRHYELTYHPIIMTTDSQKHYGSIFFPQPDGTGVLYNLQGTAEPPKLAGAITQEIPCKTAHTELLTVENWLRRPQRFRVDVHTVKPDKLDRSVSLHGLDYIDVPALGKRDYKLHFYSFKECSILAKVTFRNELSGEYLYYHVSFKSTPPGIMGTIELSTPVRKSASHVFTITNPLPTPVTLTTNCNVPDISMPTNFLVGAQSEGKCMFEYLPLKVGEITGKLTLSNSDLGVYQYELHLQSTCPPPERPIHFTTSLGVSQQQAVRFVSYARGRTEYACKVDNGDFHVEKSITVASAGSSGTEASVDVNFEPSHLGDTPANLTISSSSGGDYSIPLHGHCLAPKPQGPFNIKPGSNISIAFRNIFTQSTQFVFSVDNPAFIVKAGDVLKARKTYNIMITYDAKQADSNVARTGKLTVTNQQSAKPEGRGKSGGISWVYYLKGLPLA